MPKPRELSPQSVYARHHLERWLEEDLGTNKEHRKRIWKVLPCKEPLHVGAIRDIPKSVQDNFDSKFVLTTTKVLEEKKSVQGSKLVMETQDGHMIETVLIQHKKHDNNGNEKELQAGRTTVCVSSQVGCQMACTFCATGTMGKIANLTAAEICEQVHHARVRYPSTKSWNVVFMGMGEPLDNYQNVVEAIFSLSDPHAFNIPLRRITLSTVGVVHAIRKLAKECPQIQLALSLHAPTNEIRQEIVPSTKGFSLEKIMKAVEEYQNNNKRSVMIEYILIDNVNASPQCAHDLAKLLRGRNCMVNLIPYNPTEAGDRFDYCAPSNETISTFQRIVTEKCQGHDGKPIRCTVRWSSARGQDIDAACGQLALKNIKTNGTHNHSDIEDIGRVPSRSRPRSNAKRQPTSKRNEQQYGDSSPGGASWFFVGSGLALGGIVLAAILWRQNVR